MSDLKRAFITTNDSTWKKVEGKDGRTYHFKDGTPKSQNAFNAATQHSKYEGQKVRVAIPSNKGPGYERKQVDPITASNLGKELRLFRDDVPGTPMDKINIDGEEYSTDELANLNKKIVDRHGADAVMAY